jgi:transposase
MKTTHPQWALAHKKPGTELRLIKGRYYLYGYKTVYDKEKKRPRKVSGPLIGSITEKEGFIPSAKRKLEAGLPTQISGGILSKEYGVAQLAISQFKPFLDALQEAFKEHWKDIVAIAYCRFIYRCPLKSIPFRLSASYLPELLEIKAFSEKHASGVLNRIGGQREAMLGYMKSFIGKGEYVLMDATDIFSNSSNISLAKKGYNSRLQYDTQFNLMYIYSANHRMPVYYRLLPGNVRDVKAFKNCLLEAGIEKAVIIADKGFYSKANAKLLLEESFRFILPLKRDNTLISYQSLIENTFKPTGGYFEHEKRIIWCKKFSLGEGLSLYLYLDEKLRVKEDSDYLVRIKTHPEEYNIEQYHKKRNRFGTIALLTNLDDTEEGLYQSYKSRMEIEVMFDSMKNVLEADHTYMQNEQTLQGWMFINHLALQWYQHLYIQLKEKELLKKVSVNDYIQLLTEVKKIKINQAWYLNEFTSQTKKLLEKLNIKLT